MKEIKLEIHVLRIETGEEEWALTIVHGLGSERSPEIDGETCREECP